MNKRQKLEVMIMRAKIHVEEIMAKHDVAWNAQEAEEEEDATGK